MMRIIISTAVLVTALAVAGAAAPNVELSIHDGRVWLVAQNATARQILAEWARVGRTRIVNGERVPGGPLTLELTGVPEREALDVVLRMAGGYIAAPRATQVADASVFDRLVIVPTSAPQAPPSPAAPPFRQPTPTQTFPPPQQTFPQPAPLTVTPGVQRIIGPDGLPVPDDQQEVPPGAQPRAQ